MKHKAALAIHIRSPTDATIKINSFFLLNFWITWSPAQNFFGIVLINNKSIYNIQLYAVFVKRMFWGNSPCGRSCRFSFGYQQPQIFWSNQQAEKTWILLANADKNGSRKFDMRFLHSLLFSALRKSQMSNRARSQVKPNAQNEEGVKGKAWKWVSRRCCRKTKNLTLKQSTLRAKKVHEEDELLSCYTPSHHLRRVYPHKWLIMPSNALAWTKPKWTPVINFVKGHRATAKP